MLVKDILPYFLLGFVLYFLVSRPIQKYKAREYCKQKGLANDLPKLKWYDWWLQINFKLKGEQLKR